VKPLWTVKIYSKNEGWEGKTGLFWGGWQWEGVRHKERVNEGKNGGCILYS
jgi:hypothetical protein